MTKLTHQQKLDALAYRFYQGAPWMPKAGDFYTTSRADLELYQVVSVENGVVRTRYTEGSDAIAEWPEAGFLTEGFGPRRVLVPEWIISAATPAPVTPSESPWQWWAGNNDEWFTVGPEDTREAIIQAATNDLSGQFHDAASGDMKLRFHIVEARNDPLRLADWIETDRLIEAAEETLGDSDRADSEYDEGPWFECSHEQENDLVQRVQRACDEWQAAHGLTFSCRSFSHTRNEEVVLLELPSEEAPTDGS